MWPLARSVRIAFMSGTCLMSTAIVSGPALAIACLALPGPDYVAGLTRAERCQVRPGIIPVGRLGTGATLRGEAFPEREVNVQCELQTHAQSRIIEVITGDITDAVEPVEHGVAMNTEALRCFLGAPVRREKRI